MSEKSLNLTRRKFMVASSAAIAAPLFTNMAGMVPKAKGAEKTYDFIDKRSCDLVVLGGGGSGMVAAVRAAQLTGKKVIVLEKASFTGGAGLSGASMRIFGSKWQKKRNLPDTTEEYARDMMDGVYWKLDPKVVNSALRGTGQFFDWLCEEGGDIEDEFIQGTYVFPEYDSEPIGPQRRGRTKGGGFGMFVMKLMAEKCKTYGVEVLTKHPVVDVEMKNGKIAAVIAKSDAGYVRVACKACIMSIGSWVNNEEILNKYAPRFAAYLKKVGMPDQGKESGHYNINYTGDGIALSEKIGAFVDYDSFCVRPFSTPSNDSKVASAMVQTSYIMTVNMDGNRFVSEPTHHAGVFKAGEIQMDQPDCTTFNIFNRDTIAAAFAAQKCIEAGKCPDELFYQLTPPYPRFLPDTMEEVDSDLKENAGSLIQADTLEELADKIGVNKQNFLETVKKYNECCEKGVDTQCFKKKDFLVPINKAPYYASICRLGSDGAFGGVRVNPDMQAYKADRKSLVEGFYVTGDFATGRHINMAGIKLQVLNDLPWAFSSGFLAGTNAGKYLESL